MANAIYPKYKEAVLRSDPDSNLLSGTVKTTLIVAGAYVYNTGHDFINDVSAGRVANSAALTAKTVTSGTFDAANTTFTAVSGPTANALIVWIDTGNEATSRLVAYIDTGVTGIPVVPNGGDINLNWNTTGIFTL
jgi:hypothetical protein